MRVAVLGLGRMGTAVATRLAEAHHEVTVWNRSPAAIAPFVERGAHAVRRPVDAWERADVCLTLLADARAVDDVALASGGLLDGHGGGVLVEMSTIDAETSARVAAAAEQRAVGYLRAPVSGNPSAVAAGNAALVVSGAEGLFRRLRDLLADVGPTVTYVGPDERARIVKLCLNLVLAGTAELIAEALVLAERHDIDRRTMLDVLGASAIGSPFVRYKTDALVADDLRSTFTTRLMLKDLALVLEAAKPEVPLPVTALTEELLQECAAAGMGEADFMALLPRLRRAAGLA